MRKLLSFSVIGTICLILVFSASGKISELKFMDQGYPRFFIFRQTEGYAASGKYTYQEWDRLFNPFGGIEGKLLEEEVPGRSKNMPFFKRFKDEHPEKMVLLHMNGRSRDPRFQGERFFAGHWLYYNGCKNLSDISANRNETIIKVQTPSLFKVDVGRYGSSTEDLVICGLKSDGTVDWERAEQVRLVSVNREAKTIQVERGCYGTIPLSFEAGKAWIAAHQTEGPWGKNSNLLWGYNYSLDCPRDPQGKTCADILLDELTDYFRPGGLLSNLDGLEFDVLFHELTPKSGFKGIRSIDTNGDGLGDNGLSDGVNRYGLGVYDFLLRLREQLGEEKIIMADGMSSRHQRAFHQLNGIESEGWPDLTDPEINDWSGGLNRHWFWLHNSRKPAFNYINHKFRIKDERVDVTPNINRLVFAVAQFCDAALTYSDLPPADSSGAFPVWDELVKGKDNQEGWLGKPIGPPVRLARSSPDLLKGNGKMINPQLLKAFSGDGVRFRKQGNELLIEPDQTIKRDTVCFKLNTIRTRGTDLTIFCKFRVEPLPDYPPEIGRLISVKLSDSPDGEAIMTWANQRPFEAGFYFRNCENSLVGLEFEVEGTGRIWLSEMTAHAYPDAIYREFENGLVLANPAAHDFTFNLGELLPGRKLRRIQGTPLQDPKTNNGEPVGRVVTLGAKDGLFLRKEAGK
ncbi:MAG: hypothetical protein ACM3YE_16565 [Bacteroidota bacterium]